MPSTSIDLEFADGSYTFRLGLEGINEIQRKCREASGVPSGIGAVFARVLKGCVKMGDDVVMAPGGADFYAQDIIEPLRQGLIGGGVGVVDGIEVKVTPALANKLIATYVLDRPLVDSWSLAASILGACVMGYDPPKKDAPAPERAKEQATAPSTTH